MGSHTTISRIAIVGGGPVGVAFGKYLLAENAFSKIDIFEQRNRVGGIWNTSSKERTRRIPIPQTDAWYGTDSGSKFTNGRSTELESSMTFNHDNLEFESPLYDYLETNIPKQLMNYSDTPFPDQTPLYPSHEEVLQYLEDYAEEVKHLIQFRTQVQDIQLRASTARGLSTWMVTTKNLETGESNQELYNAVVVANGHYTVPFVPNILGLAAWNTANPSVIMHSKAYTKPEAFEGQKVLVIGNSASGLDLAAQIGQYSKSLYLSSRSESIFGQTKVSWREDIDEIAEFLNPANHDRAIRTKSGITVEGFDSVIFATGYLYSFPFLSSLNPPIITDGLRTSNIYKHFIHAEYPELAFPVLNIKVVPFGLAENQAAVIARIWSGRLKLPSLEDMRQWDQQEQNRKGSGKHYHVQKFPDDGLQMNELYEWAKSADRRADLMNEGQGKLGMTWDVRMVWLRSCFVAIKAAYNDKKAQRRQVRTVEQLGFSFDKWKEQATPEDLEMFKKARCPSEPARPSDDTHI